ncbi:Swt1 family HEPN domain-containing protein [Bradyrhizobium sp. CB1015]|uniref:Swt1 family HEPN domain-containing protein n=1 Tax=Bradyrhizobium sp. CB1015 TaxID=2976822 RepID=UPI0021AAA46C|nr:Swt1 family HEPN domain-containing protein [Bradyrhizobium sp. CB1015]UWU89107.1 Swt1 family HEPN domain-containing protein [Bradyrhizobium sp. CB1015]
MKTDDYLRSFGMSGLIVTEELKGIEQKFEVELGHVPRASQQSAADYYPQFEQSVRQEAAQMAQHYELFYCLEQGIRKLIIEAMEDAAGTNWWEEKTPQQIRDEVKRLRKAEVDSGVTRRSDRAIDYTTFGQLSVIISSNWPLFEPILKSPRAVEKVMSSLNLLRGPIAHCCPLSEDEIDRLHLTVKDWFRMIG